MARVISVVGWKKFQHYKDRDPPWVKLYRDLLTTESWVLGTDISRLVQVASLLLAARYNNQIPYLWDLIRRVSHLGCSEGVFDEAIAYLSVGGFLEIQDVTDALAPPVASCTQHASNMLATCSSEKSREEQSRADACAREDDHRDQSRPDAGQGSKHGDDETTPSQAAQVCIAMKAEGLLDGNSAHPDLLALLAEGAETREFVQAAAEAHGKGKGFAYALAIVRGRRRDAAQGKPSGLKGPLRKPGARGDGDPFRGLQDAFEAYGGAPQEVRGGG